MSAELLHHCIERIQERPRCLTIHQSLDKRAQISITRAWAKARFDQQQTSIVKLHPDHPDYGRGLLWFYELNWTEAPELRWNLTITHNQHAEHSPRELILLASAIEGQHPFPYTVGVFKAAKVRMLGRETKRKRGSILPTLRPAVANVQLDTRGGQNYIRVWDFKSEVSATF